MRRRSNISTLNAKEINVTIWSSFSYHAIQQFAHEKMDYRCDHFQGDWLLLGVRSMRQPCMMPVVWLDWLIAEVKVLSCCFIYLLWKCVCLWLWCIMVRVTFAYGFGNFYFTFDVKVQIDNCIVFSVIQYSVCIELLRLMILVPWAIQVYQAFRLHDSYCIRNIVQTCLTWYPLRPNDYSAKEAWEL